MDSSVFSTWARGRTIWATSYFPSAGILANTSNSRLAQKDRGTYSKHVTTASCIHASRLGRCDGPPAQRRFGHDQRRGSECIYRYLPLRSVRAQGRVPCERRSGSQATEKVPAWRN